MRLVVFDLDHTLLRGNSSFQFGCYLYQKKFFSSWALLASLCDYACHKWLGMSLLDLHRSSYARLFKGRLQNDVAEHVTRFLDLRLSNLLNQHVWERLKAAQNAGHHVLILSSSPDFIVREIARRLAVDRWKATSYAVDDQARFCGVSQVVAGTEKADFVTELAQQLKLPLNAVTAYSDCLLDLPILKLAGEVVCVCPNRQLRRMCRQNGWEVINRAW